MTKEEYQIQAIDNLIKIHDQLVNQREALEDIRFAGAFICAVVLLHFGYTVFKSKLAS